MSKLNITKNELIKLYWGEKKTLKEIGVLYGVTPGAIKYVMNKMKIKARHSGPEWVNISRKYLEKWYVNRGLSARQIAERLNCESTVVYRRLTKYNLPVRPPKVALNLDRKQLLELYVNKKLSTYKIAEIYRCDPKTVYRYLLIHGIRPRTIDEVIVSKEELIASYQSGKSLKNIGKKFGCNAVTILKKFRKYGIQCRSTWEANIKHVRNNFSGDREEEAYLIGFRIGDLNVKQKTKQCFIGVKSSTTKIAQLKLERELFEKYGPVWISGPNKGIYHFGTSLDQSFKFLIPKHKVVPTWIKKNKKFFLSFIAGYADAEGSIGIYSGRAKFRIGSYDKVILNAIHEFLLKEGIRSLFNLETKAGVDSRGIKRNGDFWRVVVNEKHSLKKVFSLLSERLRHEKRLFDLQRALENVENRI